MLDHFILCITVASVPQTGVHLLIDLLGLVWNHMLLVLVMMVLDVFILLWLVELLATFVLLLLYFLQVSFGLGLIWGLGKGGIGLIYKATVTRLELLHIEILSLRKTLALLFRNKWRVLKLLKLRWWKLLLPNNTNVLMLLCIWHLLLVLCVIMKWVIEQRNELLLFFFAFLEPTEFKRILREWNLLLQKLPLFILVLFFYNHTLCYKIPRYLALMMFFPLFDIFEIVLSKWLFFLLRLLWMHELLLFKVLPSDKLTWIADLVIVLVILVLLNILIWLPTTSLAFWLSLPFYLLLILHYHFLILGISHLGHIWQLVLLHLVWRWVIDNLFRRHRKSLLLLQWILLISLLLN